MEEVERASVTTKLKLGLLEEPCALFKTTGDPPARPKFERVERGKEQAEKVDPLAGSGSRSGRGGSSRSAPEEEPPEYVRGVRKPSGDFVDVTDALERIEEDSRLEAVEVLTFIDLRHAPPERVTGSYYLAARSVTGLRLAAVLRRALRQTGRAAVVRFTKRKGQRLGILKPHRSGALLLCEVAWEAECRAPNDECLAHEQARCSESEVEAAAELIHAMAGRRADLDGFEDRRWRAEQELYARAQAGELDDYVLEPEELPEELADLQELLAAAAA